MLKFNTTGPCFPDEHYMLPAHAFPTGYSTIIDVTGTPGFLFLSGEKTWMVK